MVENKNIYKGLECHCNEFEIIPIDRRDLGIAGVASSYTLSIGGAAADYKMNEYLKTQEVSKGVRTLSSVKITANFGILNYLFKKVEGKSNERTLIETGIEIGIGIIAIKTGVSLLTRIATGAATGAAVGSAFPIVGTIIGAVAGTLLAGAINDVIFEEEDKKLEEDKAYNAEIDKQVEQYNLKINRINDYLIRNNYVELRELDKDIFGNPLPNSNEAETLCKEASNIHSSYFKTILLMLSFPQYLDRRQEDEEQKQQEIKIQPIKDAILITLEIEKCIDTSKAELLKEKEIYIYNERFKRVVAKGTTDSKGYLKIDNVSVGKEIGIDRLSFVVDRENLSEDNFDLSIAQYSSITNVQTKHKKIKELKLPKAHFSFNIPQAKLQCNCEVLSLKIHKSTNTITFIPKTNLEENRYKPYLQFAYRVFEITDTQIDTSIKNITLQNRQMSGLNSLGNGLKTQYPIKKDWENKVVVFFAFFNTQQRTPYAKTAFVEKPIVVLDAGHGGKDSGAVRNGIYEKTLTLSIAKKYKKNSQIPIKFV